MAITGAAGQIAAIVILSRSGHTLIRLWVVSDGRCDGALNSSVILIYHHMLTQLRQVFRVSQPTIFTTFTRTSTSVLFLSQRSPPSSDYTSTSSNSASSLSSSSFSNSAFSINPFSSTERSSTSSATKTSTGAALPKSTTESHTSKAALQAGLPTGVIISILLTILAYCRLQRRKHKQKLVQLQKESILNYSAEDSKMEESAGNNDNTLHELAQPEVRRHEIEGAAVHELGS